LLVSVNWPALNGLVELQKAVLLQTSLWFGIFMAFAKFLISKAAKGRFQLSGR
jgi:hypothetical protein